MPNEVKAGPVEFTPEAERTVEERTKAFGEELRLAAIDEAIRRRGSASEVNASDVLRAAASALEQESLKAYEQKLDVLAKMLQEQAIRSQVSTRELSQVLTRRLEALADTAGMTKDREKELQSTYQALQEQSFANVAELRHILERELHMLRHSLEEDKADNSRSRSSERLTRLAWAYIGFGLITSFFSLITFYLPTVLRSSDPRLRTFALLAVTGLGVALVGVLVFAVDKFRRLFQSHLASDSYSRPRTPR